MTKLEELKAELNKINTELSLLVPKAKEAQATLSGNWPTGVIKQLESALTGLESKISALNSRKISVQADLTSINAETEALKRYNALQKSIATTQKNLAESTAKRDTSDPGSSKWLVYAQQVESATRALKLFNAQAQNYDSKGYRKPLGGQVNLSERLRLTNQTTNPTFASDDALSRIQQKKQINVDQLIALRGSTAQDASTKINSLTNAITRLNEAEARLSQSKASYTVPSSIPTRSERVASAERQRVSTPIPTPDGSTPKAETPKKATVPGPFDIVPDNYKQSVENAKAALKESKIALDSAATIKPLANGLAQIKGRSTISNSGKDIPSAYNLFVDDMGRWGLTLKELNRKRLLADPKYAQLFDEAKKLGYNPDTDFKSMKSQNSGAVSQALFRRDNSGVTESQYLNMDKVSGSITKAAPQAQYRNFAQGIGKDIGDLLKWSVAISAIYGPINAMSEAMTQLIENESKLADISIALNSEVADTNTVFDAVYESAKRSGESVSGVIDAFGAAYTAAGRISNEFQRYDTTVKLLDDSLKLSKLSTLDQAGAIDVLTAALYQSAKAPNPTMSDSENAAQALGRGSELIDKWVKVSKIASVDVATLATGVAVLGDSAETAGLSIEQLNAIIATISETSLSGGKEAANIAKALIGNYQTAGAVKELNRLGIAVQDSTGKTREFYDVMQDVARLRAGGLLQDQDFNRLTLAIGGGGIRRQKDVAAFIENIGRVDQITEAQKGGGGESAEALAKKLDIVQTSSTNLANSFTSLAQTLGNEGGLLDIFSLVLSVGTSTVEMFDMLAGKIGKVSPLLIGAGLGSILMKGRGGAAGLQNMMMSNLGMGATSAGLLTGNINPFEKMFPAGKNAYGAGTPWSAPTAMGSFGGRLSNATTIPSLAAIALPAIQNASQGDYTEAGANIAGGIAGALAGGPVGALVGSAIAEAFVRTTMTYESDFADLFAGTVAFDKNGKGVGGQELSVEQLNENALKEFGGGNLLFGRLKAYIGQEYSRGGLLGGIGRADNKGSLNMYDKNAPGSFVTPGAFALEQLKKNSPDVYKTLVDAYSREGKVPEGTQTRMSALQEGIGSNTQTSEYLRSIQLQEQNKLRKDVISGDIKQSDYANRLSSISAFSTTATGWMAALVSETGKLPEEFSSSQDAYSDFLAIISSGNQEAISAINAYKAELEAQQMVWDNWDPKVKVGKFTVNGVKVDGTKEDLANAMSNTADAYVSSINSASSAARVAAINEPKVFGSNINPMPQKDLDLLLSETKKFQDVKYQELPPETYEDLKDSFDKTAFLVEEGGKLIHKSFEGIDTGILSEVYGKLKEDGKISGSDKNGLDFTTMDITRAQLEQAVPQAAKLTKDLESKGYKSNVEDVLIATTDEQISVQHTDMKILQYILNQILDTEKKQLQGIWNMPEGSSFWVPLQSIIDGYGANGGSSKTFDLKDPSVYGKTAETPYSGTPGEELSMYNTTIKELIDAAKPITELTSKEEYLNKFPSARGATSQDEVYKSPTATEAAPTDKSGIEQLLQWLRGFLPADPTGPMGAGRGGGIPGNGSFGGKAFSPSDNSQAIPQTKMDIKFSSTTNLVVDGRVLASIVKPYLASDLMKANESGGTITRSYVI